MKVPAYVIAISASVALVRCAHVAEHSVSEGMGSAPALPPPHKSLIPTVNVARAVGWAHGAKPQAAANTIVNTFASDLQHPRWLHVLPNGDVLVAETNAPPRPDDRKGLKGWVMKRLMKKAGAGVPSTNRITLLRDTNADGVADQRSVLVEGLNSPFGMAWVNNQLFVANTDAVVRYPLKLGETKIAAASKTIAALPAGNLNHHWTKNLIANSDGSKVYVTVGSNSNVAEYGMAVEVERASILEIDTASGSRRIYASGLRNPNGMVWETSASKPVLWTVVNERDEIGSDLVPDYLTSVRDGGFYGWPYSYFGQHVDERVKPPMPTLVSQAIVPDYALGPHTASLGLVSSVDAKLPAPFKNGMFIGQHGSWNRKPHSGYKVIFVPFANGKPSGASIDVLTGFLNDKEEALGRPVGVAIDKQGALLVADDVGSVIWRVSPR
jgi:glucose/arabinose dehydrogenase